MTECRRLLWSGSMSAPQREHRQHRKGISSCLQEGHRHRLEGCRTDRFDEAEPEEDTMETTTATTFIALGSRAPRLRD